MSKVVTFLAALLIFPALTIAHGDHHHAPVSKATATKKAPVTKKVKAWSPRENCSGVYGNKKAAKATMVSFGEFMKNHAKYKGKLIRLYGRVNDVCSKKGCWMMLTDGKNLMRIRFKGYSFFVPTNSKGYSAVVEGYGRLATIPQKVARHYALDAGDKEGAAKIKGPQKAMMFMANWVQLYK